MYNPWFQLVASLISMIMIANLQYSWTLFVNPIRDAHAWQLSGVQGAFAFFILLQTWVQPLDGCAEVFARSRRQVSHQRDFPQQLQGVAHVLDRTLGVEGPGCAASPIEGAAPLGTAPPIHDFAAFVVHHHDQPPARLRAAVGPGPTVSPHPRAVHGWRAGAVAGPEVGKP